MTRRQLFAAFALVGVLALNIVTVLLLRMDPDKWPVAEGWLAELSTSSLAAGTVAIVAVIGWGVEVVREQRRD